MFIDKASGRDNNRPQLQAMLDYVRDGDVILVHSLDRIGRNLVHPVFYNVIVMLSERNAIRL